jgi:hypothetical protein
LKLFIVIIGLRIASISLVNGLNFKPLNFEYISYHLAASVIDNEQDITAAFITLIFLRALKFLIIPEFSGVTVRAIIDVCNLILIFYFLFFFFNFNFVDINK